MTEQAAEQMAERLNATAPEGVSYEVRATEVPSLTVTPYFVVRVVT